MTPEQEEQMRKMKSWLPYRIIYGAIKGDEFVCNAVTTMRQPNKLAREGWAVFTLK